MMPMKSLRKPNSFVIDVGVGGVLLCFLFSSLSSFLKMSEVNIATLNVNGAREMKKRAEIFEVVKQRRIDVVMLQETHSDLKNAADWAGEWGGVSVLSHKTSLSGGVAILFAKTFSPHSYQVEEIVKGRLLKVRATFEQFVLVFICVYIPTSAVERIVFLNTLCSVLQKCCGEEHLFLGGDFNCTLSNLDRNHVEPHLPSRNLLTQLVKTHDLCDIWRQFHEKQRQYTWTHIRDSVISLARLDRFYVFKHHCNIVRRCLITPLSFSDHSMVQCSVFLNSIKPRSAYWQLNTNLLSDKYFKSTFKLFWDDFRTTKSSFKSLRQWWDFGKVQIKQFCLQYTQNVTREITLSMNTLEADILKLQEMAETTGARSYLYSLLNKKTQLADLLGGKTQGALVRSRFQSLDQMDAPSKFFFNLEKKNGQSRAIHALRSESGGLLTDPADIRKRAVTFYENLYRNELGARYRGESEFFDDLPQVSEEANTEISGALSTGELYKALQKMESGKAPGIDGLPVDFYKSFWSDLKEDLLEVLNESLAEGQLPVSCRRAVLTLLPKKGDLTEIKCWRPVSLLCSDYKLLSKTLANRLAGVMDSVIHPDQTYCVPRRSVFDNISLVRDVLEVSKLLNLDCGLISLDQEKAFDRVEHCYLWRVLEAFGFSQNFINSIKVLYSDVQSILKVNGGLCAPFSVHRGIRQGCSLSGMLYSLAIEPLLQQIRAKLHGICLPNCKKNLILSAYADDVIVMITRQSDIQVLLRLLRTFKGLSSARINWGKSESLLIGKWADGKPELPEGLSWGKFGFKYLGVFLGDESTVQKNWEGVIEKVKGRLNKWKCLVPKMSYRGRILIINNLVASSLWHRFACVDPPSQLLTKIQAILIDFFWDKLHWVPQNVLFLPKEEGGHGLIHLQSRIATFRLQFVQKLLVGSVDFKWCAVTYVILQNLEGLGLDRTLFLMDPLKLNTSSLPVFYRNIFKVWSLFFFKKAESPLSLHWLLEEPLMCGARLDLSVSGLFPGLSKTLINSKVTKLGQLLEIAGPDFKNEEGTAQRLGFRSTRLIAQLLEKWSTTLNATERTLLTEYGDGLCNPNPKDSFPCLFFSLNLEGVSGVFFEVVDSMCVDFFSCTGKVLYKCCVINFNKKMLNERTDTPWRAFFKLSMDKKPEWRALYKPPLTKKTGDLQWRILHGAVAVNAFTSIINPEIDAGCPFCTERETIFHTFVNCARLESLFLCLGSIFKNYNESFSMVLFVFGCKYVRKKRFICQLLNFILGQAKLAIYVSRKKKMEQNLEPNVVTLFLNMVQARILIDFRYYKHMDDLAAFEEIWCYNEALCSVFEGDLVFTRL